MELPSTNEVLTCMGILIDRQSIECCMGRSQHHSSTWMNKTRKLVEDEDTRPKSGSCMRIGFP